MPSESLTEMLPVRMDKPLRDRLKSEATKQERDEAWVVRKALKEYLGKLDADASGKRKGPPGRH